MSCETEFSCRGSQLAFLGQFISWKHQLLAKPAGQTAHCDAKWNWCLSERSALSIKWNNMWHPLVSCYLSAHHEIWVGAVKEVCKWSFSLLMHSASAPLLPHGWSGLWWAGSLVTGHTARRGRYRSSFPSLSGHRRQSVGWEGPRAQRRGLWPGTDTTDASAVGFGCWSPSAAAGPPPRTDPETPTWGGYGRSPVSQREICCHISLWSNMKAVSPSVMG